MPIFTTEQQWQVMDSYFKSHVYPLTKHHIDSYREFLRNYIPSIIRTFNPITMIKLDSKGEPLLTVRIFVGGEDSGSIFIDRPTMIDANRSEVLLTPAEARLRNLTYEGHLYADVKVVYELADRDKDRVQTTTFPKVLLGAIPIMVHSDACILNGQGPDVLKEFGECIYDAGGYFIIDGKEKVIVSQERIANNKLFVEDMTDDANFGHRAYIKCVGQKGESKLAPKGFEMYIARDKNTSPEEKQDETEDEPTLPKKKQSDYIDNAIYISFKSVRGKIPLFMLFRALGVETDKEIIETIFGTCDIPDEYIKYIRASIIAAHTKKETFFTQAEALDYFKYRVQYQLIDYVKNLLVTDIFPNVENQNEKPMYLGYLVRQLLDTCLNIYPKTDRDAYTTKRIDISGFQLAGLFQQVYKALTKNCRDLLDREYNLGPWRNNGNNRITDLVRKDNIYKLFPPAIMTERLVRSLKGMWGSTDKDTEQGKVQDLARISYLGYLSHMRRINLPLDRSRRNVPPHRLHPQQWGFFCPFETPDGQSIGLLKNFSLMSYITFGTSQETIQEYLPRLGIIPLHNTMGTVVASRDNTKVLLNGTWYGITKEPVYHTRVLKALRRNGYINPFVSISWNIRENTLHIQTDPGRMCRPLFVLHQKIIEIPDNISINWFSFLFGDGGSYLSSDHGDLKKIFYTEEMYYKDEFILPSWWRDPVTAEDRVEIINRLEKSQGCIEFVDVDEENTLLIAMNLGDLSGDEAKDYTHCEIHPSAAFSVVTNTIPFANHNYAARNLFHGAQAKQTVGVYATNFRKRFDTMAYIMHYPQKPIVTTRNSHYIGSNRMPNGVNVIVAVATYSGFNQEDGIIINRSAIERGLFQSTAYKTMTATEKVISQNECLQFKNPYIYIDALKDEGIPNEFINILRDAGYTTVQSLTREDQKRFDVKGITKKDAIHIFEAANSIRTKTRGYNHSIKGVKPSESYSFLDENGIIREGSKIPRGAKVVVMGMVNVLEEQREVSRGILSEIEKTKHYTDVSYMTDVHHYGIVDKVFVGTKALGSPEKICKVRFRKLRRPEIGDKCCLTPDHDVLTTDGWVPIINVTKNHKVCSLEADGNIKYVHPTNIYSYECDNEELYHIKSQQIDIMATMNHKMYVKLRNKTEYELIEAEKIMKKRVSYKKSAINTNPDYKFILPEIPGHPAKELPMDAFLEFFGFWISDGWARYSVRQRPNRKTLTEDYTVELSQVKPCDRKRLIEVIRLMGYNPITGSKDKVKIASKQLTLYLLPLSVGAPNKRLPDWVWKLSEHQCHVLYEGLRRGDGTVTKTLSDIYYTSSPGLADDVQRLALHAGWCANIKLLRSANHKTTLKDGRVIQAKHDSYTVRIVKAKCEPTVNHGHVHTQKEQVEEVIKYTGSVHCLEVPSHIFYIRRNGKPVWSGNSSRHGQKGVFGMILPEASMPMTKDGIVPDIIINPHALPSRMTIAHLVECIVAKGCCFDGAQGDGTMFIPVDYNAIGATLEEQGFNKYGNEIMYDGRTGRQIGTDIFIGPTFYYRLKHMVSDKVHARPGNPEGLLRADLPYDRMTRQPTEGRARNGGLRVGEMERDVLISYGMAQFSKESAMDRSDRYRYGICRHCGIIANPGRNRKVFTCPSCKSSDSAIVETPYAWKLLVQEFEALGIEMRYVTEDIPKDEEDDFMIGFDDSDTGSEQDGETEEDYDHNQDLDEPALYDREEHIQYGGLSEEIIEEINTELNETSQPLDGKKEQPMVALPENQTDSKPFQTVAGMAKEVLNEPSIPIMGNIKQAPIISPFQTGGGTNQIPLDLDDNGLNDDFFTDIPMTSSFPINGGNSDTKPQQPQPVEIKTIILSDKTLKYRSPSVRAGDGDEFDGGDYDGGDYEGYGDEGAE